LDAVGVRLTKVVFLQASDELVYQRLDDRKLDPYTGLYYGPNDVVPSEEISARLIQPPEDSHAAIRNRLTRFKENADDLM
jgi:hypothetical protein